MYEGTPNCYEHLQKMQEWGPNSVVTHGITLGALVRHTHILPQPDERTPTKKGQRFLDRGVIIPPGEHGCYVLARLNTLVDGVIHETSFGNQTHRSLVVITPVITTKLR